METEENNLTKEQLKPIICPVCGSKQIALVTEYHKSILCRILSLILFAIITLLIIFCITETILNKSSETEIEIAITLSIFLIILKSITYYIESKTSVRAICRDCGKSWLIDLSK